MSDSVRPEVWVRQQISYFNGSRLVEVHEAESGTVWLNINGLGNDHSVRDQPDITIFFSDGLEGRKELLRLAADLEEAARRIMQRFEESLDRQEAERKAKKRGQGVNSDELAAIVRGGGLRADNTKGLVELLESKAAKAARVPVFTDETPEELDEARVLEPKDPHPPLQCSCPRNAFGRSSTDPTCPLHAGDARD